MSRSVYYDSEGNDITEQFINETSEAAFKDLEAKPAKEVFDEILDDDPKMSCRETVLEEAKRCICQDRQDQYGAPEDSFANIANYWTLYLLSKGKIAVAIDPADVALMMVLLKIARTTGHEHHVDNYVDMAGYAALAAELSENELR